MPIFIENYELTIGIDKKSPRKAAILPDDLAGFDLDRREEGGGSLC
jgi:hypothetical protein